MAVGTRYVKRIASLTTNPLLSDRCGEAGAKTIASRFVGRQGPGLNMETALNLNGIGHIQQFAVDKGKCLRGAMQQYGNIQIAVRPVTAAGSATEERYI